MSRHLILKPSLFILLCLLLTWSVVPVSAATLTVTSTADSGAGSLRAALGSAANGDTINFTVSGTIQLLSNLPNITITNLTINGNNATIQGGTDIRIFTVNSGASVTINNLTMTGGNCNSLCPVLGFGSGELGGGIYNLGTVTISNSTFSNNNGSTTGGGIYSRGTVTISGSTFSNN